MTAQSFRALLLLIVLEKFPVYLEEYKVQPCDVTKEPFQVTYDKSCGRACFQACGNAPDLTRNCMELPQYCEGLPATCGATGCECLLNSLLPSNDLTSSPNHVVAKIICESEYIEVYIRKCAINNWGFTFNDLYIDGLTENMHTPSANDVTLATDANNTCRPMLEASKEGFKYLFRITNNLTACNGQKQVDGGNNHVTITNVIKGTSKVEERRQAVHVTFSCSYTSNEIEPLGVSMQPSSHEVEVHGETLHQDFNLSIDLWRETWNGEMEKYTDDEAMTPEQEMYITVGATLNGDSRFKMQILHATVGTSNSNKERILFPLIKNGCPDPDQPFGAEVFVNRNGHANVAEFRFRLFEIPSSESSCDREKVYVHVTAHLCDIVFEGRCWLDCSSSTEKILIRKKKSFNAPRRETKDVTSAPITIQKWHKKINETGYNITVIQALGYITESWEVSLLAGCILLLIFTLMISMCVLLLKLSKTTPTNKDHTL